MTTTGRAPGERPCGRRGPVPSRPAGKAPERTWWVLPFSGGALAVDHVNFRDLSQQGFIVFVSANAAVRDRWLAAGAQPAGWPPQFLGARVFALPGPGARVVVAPYAQDQNGGTPHSQTATLVRDFMLDILAAHDEKLSNSLAAVPVPSWSEEGIAVAVQALYQANTDPAPATC